MSAAPTPVYFRLVQQSNPGQMSVMAIVRQLPIRSIHQGEERNKNPDQVERGTPAPGASIGMKSKSGRPYDENICAR